MDKTGSIGADWAKNRLCTSHECGVFFALVVGERDHLEVDVRTSIDEDGLLQVGPGLRVRGEVSGVLEVNELRGRAAESSDMKPEK